MAKGTPIRVGVKFTGSFGVLKGFADDQGRMSYWLNDEPVSKDEAGRVVEQFVLERHRRRGG